MQRLRCIAVSPVFEEPHRHIDKSAAPHGVHLKADELLMKAVIAAIHQQCSDAAPFLIESVDGKSRSFMQPEVGGVVLSQDGGDAVILYVVTHMAYHEGLAGNQFVDGLEFFAFHFHLVVDLGIHVSHVLHGPE